MNYFVLEIGTEELPARFLASLEKELEQRFLAALTEADISHQGIQIFSTPRRCMVSIQGLPDTQPKREEVALGPSIKAAYDDAGQPTRAAEGFAKGQGVDLSALFTQQSDKGTYVAARKTVGGNPISELLASICPTIINALPFPKRMRWGKGCFAYARPIHWILALFNDQIVPFQVGNLHSARQTWGHRVHGPGPFEVNQAQALEKTLQDAGVIVSSSQRRHTIIQGGNAQAAALSGTILWKDSLLDEVQGLTEHPVPLVGDFDPAYLEIPRQVLLTSMESHQKSFGLEDSQGKLLPHFLTVLNTTPKDLSVVKKGWERVLRARLEDASFYWKADLEQGFGPWQESLNQVIFLGPLGSMGDKCRRISALTQWMAEQTQVADPSLAARAGLLSKADLVSEMVGEFDTLQGIMGGIYARIMNENEAVAQALPEQYLPAGPDSPTPLTHIGSLLSIADKADTLVGCFGLGNIPTGAADPFALRRCALGIARILQEKGYNISVAQLFNQAHSLYNADIRWKLPKDQAQSKLQDFFTGRLKNYFAQNADTLLVEAVLSADADQVSSVHKRLQALVAESALPGFADTAQTFKRVFNIVRKQEAPLSGQWKSSLLTEEADKSLAEAITTMGSAFQIHLENQDYPAALALTRELRPAVDNFFNNVMVMAEDTALRENRLNLLQAILNHMGKLADFSALQM